MPRFTLLIGVVLIVLGLAAYFGSGRSSWTALIPSIIGVLLAFLGAVAANATRRKAAMHAAVGVAMVAFLASIRGLPAFLQMLSGNEVERPTAAVVQVVTAVLCFLLVAGGVRSFARARMR